MSLYSNIIGYILMSKIMYSTATLTTCSHNFTQSSLPFEEKISLVKGLAMVRFYIIIGFSLFMLPNVSRV